jgi:hypothetical protein
LSEHYYLEIGFLNEFFYPRFYKRKVVVLCFWKESIDKVIFVQVPGMLNFMVSGKAGFLTT